MKQLQFKSGIGVSIFLLALLNNTLTGTEALEVISGFGGSKSNFPL